MCADIDVAITVFTTVNPVMMGFAVEVMICKEVHLEGYFNQIIMPENIAR